MMEYVLIDPSVFLPHSEENLSGVIEFFHDVIELTNSGVLNLCLYKEITDKMSCGGLFSFPIYLNEIKDEKLKETALIVNKSFYNTILNNYECIDIDSCSGEQEFCVTRRDLMDDNDYFAFFSMLTIPCYKSYKFSDNVLMNFDNYKIRPNEEITITCNCKNNNYKHTYRWSLTEIFFTDEYKALKSLRTILDSLGDIFVESPNIIKGDHHNRIQGKDFNSFRELSYKNKRVLSSLRNLGLSDICFGAFRENNKNEIGSIKIKNVISNKNADTDKMEAWFFSEKGYQIDMTLYFPKGIGENLNVYSHGELNQKNTNQILSDLGIRGMGKN